MIGDFADGIECEWKEGGQLRTRQVRDAIRYHPVTNEPVWFNHAAFFHYSSQPEPNRSLMIAEYGVEGLPYNVTFGDGGQIDEKTIDILRDAYLAERVVFPWRPNDIMLLDNMSVAHAREPYEGDRRVLVAMTNPHSAAA